MLKKEKFNSSKETKVRSKFLDEIETKAENIKTE
jgi:hypothetical protein